MSPSSGSADSASFDVQKSSAAAARTVKATRATAVAVARRFAGRPQSQDGWVRFGIWVSTFLSSPAARGEAAAATRGLLDWVDDGAWATLYAQSSGPGPPPMAVVTAGRYLSIAEVPGAYDLDEDRPVDLLPSDWVESRVFNLRSVYKISRTRG